VKFVLDGIPPDSFKTYVMYEVSMDCNPKEAHSTLERRLIQIELKQVN